MAEAPMKVTGDKPRFALLGKVALLTIVVLAILPALATLRGCDDKTGGNVASVKLGGEWFHVEIAADDPTRMKGLGQRTQIEKDGGMIFVFPYVRNHTGGGFVMRDCPIDIDIIYVGPEGRVGTMLAMKKEPARGPDEGKAGDFGGSPGAEAYERRLKQYNSRYDYQFAIELQGGTLERLKDKIHEGDKIEISPSFDELKRRVK